MPNMDMMQPYSNPMQNYDLDVHVVCDYSGGDTEHLVDTVALQKEHIITA